MHVVVLEPHEVLRRGLAAMLARLDVISSLECHRSAGELFAARKRQDIARSPDIVIISCVQDEDAADRVRSHFPTTRVLELFTSAEHIEQAVAAKTHADGYLMVQDITEATLERTLQSLMRGGELPIPLPVAKYLFDRARSTGVSPPRIQPHFGPGEHAVITLLLEGLSNKQIAQKLGISVHSAKRRVSAVLHKTNSPSRAHFVAQMLRDT